MIKTFVSLLFYNDEIIPIHQTTSSDDEADILSPNLSNDINDLNDRLQSLSNQLKSLSNNTSILQTPLRLLDSFEESQTDFSWSDVTDIESLSDLDRDDIHSTWAAQSVENADDWVDDLIFDDDNVELKLLTNFVPGPQITKSEKNNGFLDNTMEETFGDDESDIEIDDSDNTPLVLKNQPHGQPNVSNFIKPGQQVTAMGSSTTIETIDDDSDLDFGDDSDDQPLTLKPNLSAPTHSNPDPTSQLLKPGQKITPMGSSNTVEALDEDSDLDFGDDSDEQPLTLKPNLSAPTHSNPDTKINQIGSSNTAEALDDDSDIDFGDDSDEQPTISPLKPKLHSPSTNSPGPQLIKPGQKITAMGSSNTVEAIDEDSDLDFGCFDGVEGPLTLKPNLQSTTTHSTPHPTPQLLQPGQKITPLGSSNTIEAIDEDSDIDFGDSEDDDDPDFGDSDIPGQKSHHNKKRNKGPTLIATTRVSPTAKGGHKRAGPILLTQEMATAQGTVQNAEYRTGMKFNPTSNRWEGNEDEPDPFEDITATTKPKYIAANAIQYTSVKLDDGSNAVWDPKKMQFVFENDEPDPFEGFSEEEEDEDPETANSSLSNTSFLSDKLDDDSLSGKGNESDTEGAWDIDNDLISSWNTAYEQHKTLVGGWLNNNISSVLASSSFNKHKTNSINHRSTGSGMIYSTNQNWDDFLLELYPDFCITQSSKL